MTTRDSRSPRGPARRVLAHLLLLSGVVATMTFLPQCGGQYALLLTIRSEKKVGTIEFKVKRLSDNKVIFERAAEKVDPSNPNRDISDPKQALKVALEFEEPGNYLVYILGRSGAELSDRYFFLRDFQVESVVEETILLKPVVADADGDGFPACGAKEVNCAAIACRFLDCNDDPVKGPTINPMAKEVCGNGLDDDCSAGCGANPKAGDVPCEDADGDGEPSTTDCDDHDPCRSTRYKEAANLCGLPPANDPIWILKGCGKASPAPHCGDGVDNDCNGQDTACVIDEDCDGFPAATDCNDKDPKINPGAVEECDGKDNNCNGIIDEGCVPCDVDGDNHANPLSTDPACNKPKDDSDDFDAGVNPGTTADVDSGGKEGGTVLGALREVCSTDVNKDKNKLRPRDVDHDGDKLAAKDDGCPPENCDEDGDGFSGSQCSPPKALEDCNDKDPKIFPGAPDRCGDGIAQGCGTDASCSCDKDGDGFCPPLDCDDNNKEIHPWALEKCDGVDNDCDKLIDEGNPDSAGNQIATNKTSCSDDNDGRCGFDVSPGLGDPSKWVKGPSGFCACSKVKPIATRDPANRLACPLEDMNASHSQRCFGATQPTLEHCDTNNWDCNDHTVIPAEPFVDAGKTCGTSVGNCKPGKVTGCDLQKTEPALVKQILGGGYNEHWVCSSDTWLPAPEVCNGKDDDCNGVVPSDEIDSDNDKFLGCGGCTKGGGRFDIVPGLDCGDCNPGSPSVFPGAEEQCNSIDDNCNGSKDETPNVCSKIGQVCCYPSGCRDLQNDFDHCGGCNKPCNPVEASRCTGGKCVCGTSSGVCPGTLNCQGPGPAAQCNCIQGGRCNGCCESNACATLGGMQNPGKCGASGAACKSCSDGNDCTDDLCGATTGACTNPNRPFKTACDSNSGRCVGASCCKGCIRNTSCPAGTTPGDCGKDGNDCATCAASNQCQNPSCSGGACGTTNKGDGTICDDGQFCSNPDTCTSGNCGGPARDCSAVADPCNNAGCNETTNQCVKVPKTGSPTCDDTLYCTDPDTCSAGGVCGGPARVCPGNECNNGSCNENADSCVLVPKTGACSGGTCHGGSCCTGCWNGTSCPAGTSLSECGSAGENCDACTGAETCTGGNCVCPGCTVLATCYAGTGDTQCGSSGACVNCTTSAPACRVGDCVGQSCDYATLAAVKTSCNSGAGKCDKTGSCCTTGCIDNGDNCITPQPNDGKCGIKGNDCIACTTPQVCKSNGTCGPP
jgi:hypothetical protein